MTKAHLIMTTESIMLVTGAIWLAWDVFAATRGQSGVTISAVTWAAIKGNPWISFLAGFLSGHLFFQSGSGN